MKLASIKVDEMPVNCGECIFMCELMVDFCNDKDPFERYCPLIEDNYNISVSQRNKRRLKDCPLEVE